MIIAEARHHIPHRGRDLDAGEETLAAHFEHIVGIFLRQLLQVPAQALTHGIDVIDKARRLDAVEHGIADRGR
ncbi:hypothetical protein D3C86_2095550 [compost metagenome]